MADEYDRLRVKWKDLLTGGTGFDPGDPDYGGLIGGLTAAAQARWDSMNKAAGRTYLWADLRGTTKSAYITEAYTRLKTMAVAYNTVGSPLQGNARLRADLVAALDWMYAHRYNERVTRYDNWWDWQIGAPLQVNDLVTLMYEALSGTQRTNYLNAVNHFCPAVTGAATNRMWMVLIVGVRGLLVKSAAALVAARDGLSPVLRYVTPGSGDGFLTDGSFLMHGRHPYNGSYGVSQIQDIANLVYLLSGSTWRVVDPNLRNIYRWVYDAFIPLMYRGSMMDMTMGRGIARYNFQNHVQGHIVIGAVLRIAQFAPAPDAAAFRSTAKGWIESDTAANFLAGTTLSLARLAKTVLADGTVPARGGLTRNMQYNNMGRAVHQRPGYAFGVSIFSARTFNYESINHENLRGWHTADGMTYLYNGDLTQFSDAFWPTVDSTRLPGTTVEQGSTVKAGTPSDQLWVGGTELSGHGATGMAMHTPGQTLKARKSWFMFDDEVVALGAGISAPAPDTRTVETIVENRKLNADGSNLLTVDGAPKSTSPGWSETMPGVTWMHLQGDVPGSDIGYYFPHPTAVGARRESRTDRWSSIDTEPPFVDTTARTRHYQTLWLDHGANPANAGYAYVLLPDKPAADIAAYAARPAVSILRNDGSAQAVRHDALGLACVNVWIDGGLRVGDVWSDKKSSIMVRHGGDTIDVSVSDPMFTNTGTINVEVSRAAGWTVRTDPAVTITHLNPTIRFRVNATNLTGRSMRLALAPAPPTLRSSPSFTDGTYRTGSHNTGIRTVEYDVTPQAGNIDGVMGLTGSATVVDAFTKLNMIVRANKSGAFDAVNGPGYRAAATIPYTAGRTYHVTIRADLNARTYTVHVTSPGGAPVLLASNYAFRSTAPAIADIGQLTLHTASADQLAVDRLQIY